MLVLRIKATIAGLEILLSLLLALNASGGLEVGDISIKHAVLLMLSSICFMISGTTLAKMVNDEVDIIEGEKND